MSTIFTFTVVLYKLDEILEFRMDFSEFSQAPEEPEIERNKATEVKG